MAAGNDLPGNAVKRAASNKITFKREEEGGGAKKRGSKIRVRSEGKEENVKEEKKNKTVSRSSDNQNPTPKVSFPRLEKNK